METKQQGTTSFLQPHLSFLHLDFVCVLNHDIVTLYFNIPFVQAVFEQ